MTKKRSVVLVILAIVLTLGLCGCAEIEKAKSNWTPAHADPKVQPRPTATEDVLVAFGAYPNTVAPSNMTNVFKGVAINAVTGLWDEVRTDTENGFTLAYYDLQSGYYVYQETKDGVTTENRYAKEGNKYYLVQEIQWIILEDLGDRYVLVSRELLDGIPFSDDYNQTTWAESSLRAWLGGTGDYARGGTKYVEKWNFFDRAFTLTEQAALRLVTNKTPGNASFGTEGGGDAEDYIYILSQDECAKYFGDTLSMQASVTPFAAKRGVLAEYKTRGGSWWLRDPGMSMSFLGVNRNGDFVEGGFSLTDSSVGVRPVIVVAKDAVRTIDNTLPTAGPIETPTPKPTAVETVKPV